MSGNRSLDEFGPPGDAEESDPEAVDSDPAATEPTVDADEPDAAEALDPPASTYVWRPEGGPCAACGESVDERWRADAGLVCVACKEW